MKQTENKGLKARMLQKIVFDTHWDKFLGNSLVFQRELSIHFCFHTY